MQRVKWEEGEKRDSESYSSFILHDLAVLEPFEPVLSQKFLFEIFLLPFLVTDDDILILPWQHPFLLHLRDERFLQSVEQIIQLPASEFNCTTGGSVGSKG